MMPLAASILVKATAVTVLALAASRLARRSRGVGTLSPGRYDCQVSVLDPSGVRAAFWRAPIAVVR